ncbi:MAG: tRNA (adenosine(37)-N6)-dimethylallyltransferase MiaA [Ilumatobacteraceae bacterium]
MSTPLVILGPTGSGKSDVAMAYAVRHPGTEIVVVDAMQVYRRMDIGTAKPTAADRAAVPHHCIDLVDPGDDFALADHTAAANAALAAIERRGGRALLVAGTGLYLRALTDPMELPGRWPDIRASLEQRAQQEGTAALHAELAERDPVAASRIEPGNERRIVRALEVILGSGRRFSSFGPGLDDYPPTRFAMIGIRWQRDALAARIEARARRMMDDGLVEEVAALLADRAGLSRTASQALGYREVIDMLEGRATPAETVEAIALHTRQYAVRQERWFRRDPRITWAEVHDDPASTVLPILERR